MEDSPSEIRSREFGAFLRSRREKLTPQSVGLRGGDRRRARGLRREEVALLADVGITWYTWLEQGREVHASAEVLTSLAEALKLDPAERAHLFQLADRTPPEAKNQRSEVIEEPLRRLLDSFTLQPAYIIGRLWDLLAWNPAAAALFGDYGRLNGEDRNILSMLFLDQSHRDLLLDWEEIARTTLAMFRADTAGQTGQPDFERLVARLTAKSAPFREWWPRQDVLRRLSGSKRIAHPEGGTMVFENTSFAVGEHPGMKMIVYTPLDEATKEKLKALLG